MDQECNKFGVGPKELAGALDLIDHFKLARHHEFFCKKSIPIPVSKAHYLNNVVGATEISQGDGMQLSQLVQNIPCTTEKRELIRVFNLNDLTEAFKFRGHNPLRVQPGLSKIELKDKEMNNEKHGDTINVMNQGSKKARKNHKHQSKHMGKDKKVKRSHQDTTTEVRLLEKSNIIRFDEEDKVQQMLEILSFKIQKVASYICGTLERKVLTLQASYQFLMWHSGPGNIFVDIVCWLAASYPEYFYAENYTSAPKCTVVMLPTW